jgi:hypothetical protein
VLFGQRHTGAVDFGPITVTSAHDCYNLCFENTNCGFWNYFPATKACYQVEKKNFLSQNVYKNFKWDPTAFTKWFRTVLFNWWIMALFWVMTLC